MGRRDEGVRRRADGDSAEGEKERRGKEVKG
jgi:hypothetical protein